MDAEADEPEEILQSIEVEVERTPSPPRGRARERESHSTPIQDDPLNAPPQSSSSESDSPVAWPTLDTLAHRTYTRKPPARAAKTPELLDDGSSELSSPPSLTHSPNYEAPVKAMPTKKKAAAPQKKVTTADLTALLPRRRQKASTRNSDSNDPFDLDDSDDDHYGVHNGEDEVSYVDSRAARRKKTRQPANKSAANRRAKAAEPGDNNKKRALRTYGSMNEEKENELVEDSIVVGSPGDEGDEEVQDELPVEETSQMMVERLGEELQQAAKKFKEVDKWELSFEVVTESSSPGPFAR